MTVNDVNKKTLTIVWEDLGYYKHEATYDSKGKCISKIFIKHDQFSVTEICFGNYGVAIQRYLESNEEFKVLPVLSYREIQAIKKEFEELWIK